MKGVRGCSGLRASKYFLCVYRISFPFDDLIHKKINRCAVFDTAVLHDIAYNLITSNSAMSFNTVSYTNFNESVFLFKNNLNFANVYSQLNSN